MGVVYVFALLMFTRSVDNVPQANMLPLAIEKEEEEA